MISGCQSWLSARPSTSVAFDASRATGGPIVTIGTHDASKLPQPKTTPRCTCKHRFKTISWSNFFEYR